MWLVFICFGWIMVILEFVRWLTWFCCVPAWVTFFYVIDMCVSFVLALLSGTVALIVALFHAIVNPQSPSTPQSPQSPPPPPPQTSAFASSVPTAYVAGGEIKGGPPVYIVAQEVHAIV